MFRYALNRLALFIPTLLLASVAVFIIMRALPGDVTAAVLGGEGEALTPELVESVRKELGLDAPLPVQYANWLASMAGPQFGGRSLATGETIGAMVARQLPLTFKLAAYATTIAVLLAVPLGVAAALYRGRWPDLSARLVSVTGAAIPGFWLALVALLLLVVYFRWSPPLIYTHLWQNPTEHLQIMALPALVLAWEYGAHLTRLTRAGMLQAMQQDYIQAAKSKGVSQSRIVLKHALRNSLIPVITVAGLHFGTLLGGAVILEYIFGLPGIGRGLVDAVIARDYPVVQSLAMLLVTLVLLINLIIDLLYGLVDPRISYVD